MHYKEIWRYGATKVVLRISEAGIAFLEVVGLVTVGVINLMRRDVISSRAIGRAQALIINFGRAMLALTPSDLPVAPMAMPANHVVMPVAFIVDEAHEELFVTLAWQQAAQGLVRAVFTDAAPALVWALERADGTSVLGDLA